MGGGERSFDPTRLPPIRKSRNTIRMMLPMSVCCNSCRTLTSKGTNFTFRIEKLLQTSSSTTHLDEGVPASFRFYFRCHHCCAHLSMKTDPLNFDYIIESGATRIPKRNFDNFDFDFDFDFGEEEEHNHNESGTKRRKLEEEEEEFGTPTPQSEGDGELDLLDLSFEERRLEQGS